MEETAIRIRDIQDQLERLKCLYPAGDVSIRPRMVSWDNTVEYWLYVANGNCMDLDSFAAVVQEIDRREILKRKF